MGILFRGLNFEALARFPRFSEYFTHTNDLPSRIVPPSLRQRVRDLSSTIADGMSSFDPPVSEDKVRDFESRNEVVLPDDYRWFITQVASGGPGPANNLFPFPLGRTDARLAEPWIDPV